MKFPLIGSAVLVSLFVLFKYLPKDLINAVLTTYFVLLGTFAITATLLPFIEPLFPKRVQQRSYEFEKLQIPYLLQARALSLSRPARPARAGAGCKAHLAAHSRFQRAEVQAPGRAGARRHSGDGARDGWRRVQPGVLLLVLCQEALARQQSARHSLLHTGHRAPVPGCRLDRRDPAVRPLRIRHLLGLLHASYGAAPRAQHTARARAMQPVASRF